MSQYSWFAVYVALAVVVFDVDQKAKAIFERNILHLGIIHLCDKGI